MTKHTHKKGLFGIIYVSIFILNLVFNTAHGQNTYTSTVSPISLPRSNRYSSVGYDESNHTILILGGTFDPNQFVTFKNGFFTDHGANYLSLDISGISQQYTQINDRLWMIKKDQPNAKLIAMQTYFPYLINDNDIVIPNSEYSGSYAACLASTQHEYHTYLFVLGGDISDDLQELTMLQIYNLTANEWLTGNIPSMLEARYYFGCIAHNNRLYAIGGENVSFSGKHNTVESVYIGDDLINIQQQQWTYVNGYLHTPLSITRAVAYGNDIIVFGGADDSPSSYPPTEINVIDTSTNIIKVDGTLEIGLYGAAVIIVDKIAYGFGGSTYTIVDDYQYIILPPTQNPTKAPTSSPTKATSSPTEATSSPTKAPTDLFTDDVMRGMIIGSIIGAFLLSGVIYCCCQCCFIHIVIHKNSKYCISFCEWGGNTTANVVLSLSNNVDSVFVYKQITFMTIVTMIGGIADVITDFVYAFKANFANDIIIVFVWIFIVLQMIAEIVILYGLMIKNIKRLIPISIILWYIRKMKMTAKCFFTPDNLFKLVILCIICIILFVISLPFLLIWFLIFTPVWFIIIVSLYLIAAVTKFLSFEMVQKWLLILLTGKMEDTIDDSQSEANATHDNGHGNDKHEIELQTGEQHKDGDDKEEKVYEGISHRMRSLKANANTSKYFKIKNDVFNALIITESIMESLPQILLSITNTLLTGNGFDSVTIATIAVSSFMLMNTFYKIGFNILIKNKKTISEWNM